ncbi:hypothetical protein WA026_009906 [Henosepilachna vigintioctopunctata]|uniref:Gamma-sarcoglycan n=1 Tax=Henosepilachna vigintioctopunctata TaxID=420089 RepID=A0AAW1TT76_9CUCU
MQSDNISKSGTFWHGERVRHLLDPFEQVSIVPSDGNVYRSNQKLAGKGKRMKKSEAVASEPPPHLGGSTTQDGSKINDVTNSTYNFRIGIYGWRKRCLYVLILVLLIMVIINLALTLWVLKVMEFSAEGMGHLRIVNGGIRLEGRAFVLDSLLASSIKSRYGQPIVIESSMNLTLSTRNKEGYLENFIFLGDDRFECLAKNFKIMDDRGLLLFSVDDEEVLVGADSLKVSGEGGTNFAGSVQTTMVRADSDLRLESPTGSLHVKAPQGVNIESRGGKINLLSFNDITLKSEVGSINLESSSILMPALPTAISTSRSTSSKSHDIYQLCVCDNGKLFLAHPQHICAVSNDDLICR